MNKTKCDVCEEKHDKIHITCECSDCYIAGAKKEREKGRQDALKEEKQFLLKCLQNELRIRSIKTDNAVQNRLKYIEKELKQGVKNEK